MPDKRKHRGPHPADGGLFGRDQHDVLREATFELSWLRGRGYSEVAALKIVGDRHKLRTRQRDAIRRGACADAERTTRDASHVKANALAGRTVALDGFNCVITVEAALSGAPLFVGRDGVYRDLASVHGSYRKVHETQRAVELLTEVMVNAGADAAQWLLDRPVSNSGRLKQIILEVADTVELPTTAELVNNPDADLVQLADVVVASGDSVVIDGSTEWIDLPAAVLCNRSNLWLVDLSSDTSESESAKVD